MKRIAIAAVAALAVAACTNPVGTDRDPAYFEAVRPAAVAVTGAITEVRDVFANPYESEAARANRLGEVRAGYDLAIAADRARRLEPASVYQADHDRYLATIADVRDAFGAYDEAVAVGDIPGAAVAATAMETAAGLGFAGLSAGYCGKVTFDMRLCDRPADPGEYQALLFTAMLELAAGYVPLLRPAPEALDDGEATAYLDAVDATAVALLETVAADLGAATPPPGAEADHAAILAMVAAAADLHRAGGDHTDLPAVFCDAAASLSPGTAGLAAVLLADDDLDC